MWNGLKAIFFMLHFITNTLSDSLSVGAGPSEYDGEKKVAENGWVKSHNGGKW